MDNYFVIHVSENGDISIREMTKIHLLEMLKEDQYGYDVFRDKLSVRDPQYWGDKNTLIIKGEIVVPFAKKVITTYNIS